MVYFLSSERLKSDFANENISDEYIKSAVMIAQQELVELLGDTLYNKLEDMVTDGSIEDSPYQELLDSFVVPMLEFRSMAELCVITSFKVGNIGMYQNYDQNASSNELSTVKYIEKHWTDKAEFYRNRLVKFLEKNTSTYPEYKCSCENLSGPSENNLLKTGLFLGGR